MDMLITNDLIDSESDWEQDKLLAEAMPSVNPVDALFALHQQLKPRADASGFTLRVDKMRKRLYARSMSSKYRAVKRETFEPALLKVAAAEAVRADSGF